MDGSAGRDFAGHTPGPWAMFEQHAHFVPPGELPVWYVGKDYSKYVCEISTGGWSPNQDAESRANARLIAAAPALAAENAELREALRNWLAYSESTGDTSSECVRHEDHARALLARLEGER